MIWKFWIFQDFFLSCASLPPSLPLSPSRTEYSYTCWMFCRHTPQDFLVRVWKILSLRYPLKDPLHFFTGEWVDYIKLDLFSIHFSPSYCCYYANHGIFTSLVSFDVHPRAGHALGSVTKVKNHTTVLPEHSAWWIPQSVGPLVSVESCKLHLGAGRKVTLSDGHYWPGVHALQFQDGEIKLESLLAG